MVAGGNAASGLLAAPVAVGLLVTAEVLLLAVVRDGVGELCLADVQPARTRPASAAPASRTRLNLLL